MIRYFGWGLNSIEDIFFRIYVCFFVSVVRFFRVFFFLYGDVVLYFCGKVFGMRVWGVFGVIY